ncbi:hypothetical protein DFH09DRAFT_1322676 [Mycena vulgaris]|nr:hypothetical protein DFH09DRAFT_1322676 [Mycena vulgaris]
MDSEFQHSLQDDLRIVYDFHISVWKHMLERYRASPTAAERRAAGLDAQSDTTDAGFIVSCRILLATDRSIEIKLWASLHHVLVDFKGKSWPNFSSKFDDFTSGSALASVLRRDQTPFLMGRVVEHM